jgi:hypothetical protein
MDKKDFEKMQKQTESKVEETIKEHNEYITDSLLPYSEETEFIVRKGLEEILETIKQFLIDEYDFVESDFDNFPTLDMLIYHENGWTLHQAIINYYKEYNTSRSKEILKLKVKKLIINESNRLCYTVFDESNDRTNRFRHVTIDGENRCGGCGDNYGTFPADSHPPLPPYHEACGCWAVWHD